MRLMYIDIQNFQIRPPKTSCSLVIVQKRFKQMVWLKRSLQLLVNVESNFRSVHDRKVLLNSIMA